MWLNQCGMYNKWNNYVDWAFFFSIFTVSIIYIQNNPVINLNAFSLFFFFFCLISFYRIYVIQMVIHIHKINIVYSNQPMAQYIYYQRTIKMEIQQQIINNNNNSNKVHHNIIHTIIIIIKTEIWGYSSIIGELKKKNVIIKVLIVINLFFFFL